MNAIVIELLAIMKLMLEQKKKVNNHWEIYLTENEIKDAEKLIIEAKKIKLI